MNLRTRLILVLLLLSVVPLGAVTVYSYVNSADALRVAAAREADLLAGELTARMQLVTSELSTRVERLMDMPQDAPTVAKTALVKRPVQTVEKPDDVLPAAEPASAAATAVVANAAASTGAASASLGVDAKVAQMLGEAAILLDTLELRGMRGTFGRQGTGAGSGNGRSGSGDRRLSGRGRGTSSGSSSSSGRAAAAVSGTPPDGDGTGARAGSARFADRPVRLGPDGKPLPPGQPRHRGPDGRMIALAAVPPVSSAATAAAAAAATAPPESLPAPAPAGADPRPTPPLPPAPPLPMTAEQSADRIVIDMSTITRDIAKRMAPDGWQNLTPEERQRAQREMGLRMIGLTERLKIGAAKRQEKAEALQQQIVETDAKRTEALRTIEPAAATLPPQTKSSLRGNKLGVTKERGGKVVQAVDAEVNLDNLLMTVFSTTRRDQREVPFAVAKDGHVYTQSAADKRIVEGFGAAARPDAKPGTTVLADWIVVTNQDPSGSGLRFGIARPVGDSLSALRKTAGRNAGLGLLFIGFALVIVVPVSRSLTHNLSILTDGVQRIARGDLSTRVSVKGTDEVTALAAAFNQMAADIEKHQRGLVEQERIKRELELCRQIQSEMLPTKSLRMGLTEITGVSVPAREVGGDFFNYFPLPTGEMALLVGDVSGKGIGAALLMANFQATLRTRLALEQDLPVIADAIDRDIAANAPRGLYATLFVGIVHPGDRRLRYVNAGHNPQYVVRVGGGLDRLHSTGTPIGLMPGRGYSQSALQLHAGDLLFFYTDGIVEVMNEKDEMFGTQRLEALLQSAASTEMLDHVMARVETAVTGFRGAREPFDDATMMVVRIG